MSCTTRAEATKLIIQAKSHLYPKFAVATRLITSSAPIQKGKKKRINLLRRETSLHLHGGVVGKKKNENIYANSPNWPSSKPSCCADSLF